MNTRRALFLTLGTLLLAICSITLYTFLPLVRNSVYDLKFVLPGKGIPDSVVVIGIDDVTIRQKGAFPWPRSQMAELIERINACQPAAIAMDFEFPRRDNDPENDSLANVFSRVPRLVLPFRARLVSQHGEPQMEAIPQEAMAHRFMIVNNHEELTASTSFYSARQIDIAEPRFAVHADRSGFINVTTSRAGQSLRELIHVIRAGNEYFPSFGVAAVSAFWNLSPDQVILEGDRAIRIGKRRVPISSYAGSSFINFRGPAGTIPTIAAINVLDGSLNPAFLKGKLVFVGMTDPGSAPDFFITPVGTQFPGVEIWASAAADIIDGFWLRRSGILATIINILLTLLIFPGLAILLSARHRRLAALGGLGVMLLSIAASLVLLQTAHLMWDPEFHIYAWLFLMMWLGVQKVDPTLVEMPHLELELADNANLDVLQAPRDNDYPRQLLQAATMQHVANLLKIDPIAQAQVRLEATVDHTMVEALNPVALTPAAAAPNDLGRVLQINDLKIIRVLGSGGMADVYLVWHPRLETYRAVKVIKPGQAAHLIDRFETEIRIVAALNHPNIVQCYTVGDWHGLPYLEMEFVLGSAMDAVINKCKVLAPEQVMAIGILVCRALHYAHQHMVNIMGTSYQGVMHRDLKPANILLSRSGRVKLTDFGIARPSAVAVNAGDQGKVVGTLPYLAPEQLEGNDITHGVDIYALGATLYELSVGTRAFPQTEISALVHAKDKGTFTSLEHSAFVPAELAAIIHKAMARKAADRFATAQEMGEALEKLLRQTVKPDAPSPLQTLVGRFWEQT